MTILSDSDSYQSFDDQQGIDDRNNFTISIPEDCSICLETQKEKELTILRCKHTFHQKCMRKWLENNRTCPMCRTYIPDERENEENNTINYAERRKWHTILLIISVFLGILGGVLTFLYLKY